MKMIIDIVKLVQLTFTSYAQLCFMIGTVVGAGVEMLEKCQALFKTDKYAHLAEPFKKAILLAMQAAAEVVKGVEGIKQAYHANPEDFKFLKDSEEEIKTCFKGMATTFDPIEKYAEEAKKNFSIPAFITDSTEFKNINFLMEESKRKAKERAEAAQQEETYEELVIRAKAEVSHRLSLDEDSLQVVDYLHFHEILVTAAETVTDLIATTIELNKQAGNSGVFVWYGLQPGNQVMYVAGRGKDFKLDMKLIDPKRRNELEAASKQ